LSCVIEYFSYTTYVVIEGNAVELPKLVIIDKHKIKKAWAK
jgi:hypothetical protein